MTWQQTKAEIFSEGQTCQVWRKDLERECGKDAEDLDHAIFPGKQTSDRRVRIRRFLDSRHNAQRSCADCNRWFRDADRFEAIEHHIHRELSRDEQAFVGWYYAPAKGISRKRGSDWQVKSIIVERCLK